jgi:hypothetical protein
MSLVIRNIDYNPPGRDVHGEHVLISNEGTALVQMQNWTLRDAAPTRPHVYVFPQFSLSPGAQVRVWTKQGINGTSDLYWGLAAAVWNNVGDTAVLRDSHGVEVSRFAYAPLPSGALPLKLVVPAFWSLDPSFDPHWQGLRNAGGALVATVIENSWPSAAKSNPSFKANAQAHLGTLPGAVLGYVGTRGSAPNFDLLPASEILNGPRAGGDASVKDWYDEFGGQIDGIYFDELIIPEKPADIGAGLTLVSDFKAAHAGAKVMILAGQCPDEQVAGPTVDWTLLWEDRNLAYRQNFAARTGGTLQVIPAWWKDPAKRRKIVHVVHDCPEAERQVALGLANERNAGNVFVMDRRGLNASGKDVFYDHLPPYWAIEVRETNSYDDFGFEPWRALLAAGRYGVKQGQLHAWPNFEGAWYGANHVRGTYLLASGATRRDVALADLPGTPALHDLPAIFKGAHEYARNEGFETALPTFESVSTAAGAGTGLILFAQNLPWLLPITVPLTDTYQQPTFAEPGFVIRNVHRWASGQGHMTGWPTFVPDDPANPRGRTNHFKGYALASGAPAQWQDVPTPIYLQQL